MTTARALPAVSALCMTALAALVLSGEVTAAEGNAGVLGARLRPSAVFSETSPLAWSFTQPISEPDEAQPHVPWIAQSEVELAARWGDPPNDRPRYYQFSRGLRPAEDYAANRHLSTNEFVRVLADEYGSSSVMGRSTTALALGIGGVQRGTQVPLDLVNNLSERLATGSRDLVGVALFPELKLRSQITTDSLAIRLRQKW